MSLPIEYFHFTNHPISYAVQMVANIVGVPLVHSDFIDQSLISEKTTHDILVQASKRSFAIVDGVRVVGDENIMRYLADRYSLLEVDLYPREPNIRASHDRLMWDLVNVVCPLFAQMQTMAFAHHNQPDACDELMEEFIDDINFLDELLRNQAEPKQFMFADHLTLADLTLSAIFTARYGVELELDELPRFERYLNLMETVIPGHQAIQQLVNENLRSILDFHLSNFPDNGRGPNYGLASAANQRSGSS